MNERDTDLWIAYASILASFLDQKFGAALISIRVVYDALGTLAVAAGPPRLLVVALDRLGQSEVDDKSHVGLVDAHAERHGGHDDLDAVVVAPLGLDVSAILAAQVSMVVGSLESYSIALSSCVT